MLLKVGSTGDDVKKLQEKLGIAADGIFGNGTANKVKEWQAANGLTADGIVGNGTWARMFPETNAPVEMSSAPVSAPVATGLNLDKLKGHVPDAVLAQIPETAARFNITSNLRLAHFLAQCSHESGNFKVVNENLNYSADGLKRIFPKYFPGETGASYARNPEKIANRVYSSRMGNGDEASGEGWKFRGRGYIQLTGKSNYSKFDSFVDDNIISNPDLVASKYPLASAAFFFNSNNLWSICDLGSDEATVAKVSKRVNGGTIGLADRIKHFKEYWSYLK